MTDSEFSHREEQLTELDLEILHLRGDKHFSPSPTVHSQSSPKRFKSPHSVESDNNDIFGHFANDAHGESDVGFEEPLPKKRRQTSRRIPSVEARSAALQELNSRRISKKARKSTGDQTKSFKMYGKFQKQKKRRLPVGELVTVSERPWDSDVEVSGSELRNGLFETCY
jgi:hypothetical protein